MPAKPRNVKSKPEPTTADAHERAKDFLTQVEMHKLLTAARKARHGARDHLLMLMMYRHGLRVSEAVALRRKHVNTGDGRLWVSRLKGSLSTEHRIDGEELRALKRYLASRDDKLPWLFVSERGAPLTRHAVNYLIASAGEKAGLGHVHPHMLRHSCGYALADKGVDFRVLQDYLGHRDPAMTARYTRVSSRRFEGLWE
jgi:integrase